MKKVYRAFLVLFLAGSLFGCYADSVKPLLNDPGFKAENEPVRTLRILLVTDGSYRKEEIERFIAKSSSLTEVQVGIRLEIVGWHFVRWKDELKDHQRMIVRIAADTWGRREAYDVTLAPVYFNYKVEGSKVALGFIDTVFWRHVFIRELESTILLHEIFHSFLPERDHARESVMRTEQPSYGREWYWLAPSERRIILQNKWRDFNRAPSFRKRRADEKG